MQFVIKVAAKSEKFFDSERLINQLCSLAVICHLFIQIIFDSLR